MVAHPFVFVYQLFFSFIRHRRHRCRHSFCFTSFVNFSALAVYKSHELCYFCVLCRVCSQQKSNEKKRRKKKPPKMKKNLSLCLSTVLKSLSSVALTTKRSFQTWHSLTACFKRLANRFSFAFSRLFFVSFSLVRLPKKHFLLTLLKLRHKTKRLCSVFNVNRRRENLLSFSRKKRKK